MGKRLVPGLARQAMARPFAPRQLSLRKRQKGDGGKVPGLKGVEEDAEFFSFMEWWPVGFGTVYQGRGWWGVRREEEEGERRLGPSMRLFLLKEIHLCIPTLSPLDSKAG